MNIQIKKSVLTLSILSTLSKKEINGYQLSVLISKKLDIPSGEIYPALRNLIEKGYISFYLQDSADNIPQKTYKLTDEGLKQKETLENEWNTLTNSLNSILMGDDINE